MKCLLSSLRVSLPPRPYSRGSLNHRLDPEFWIQSPTDRIPTKTSGKDRKWYYNLFRVSLSFSRIFEGTEGSPCYPKGRTNPLSSQGRKEDGGRTTGRSHSLTLHRVPWDIAVNQVFKPGPVERKKRMEGGENGVVIRIL